MLGELLASPGVEEVVALRGDAGVLALHGGIEEHTEYVAAGVADVAGASHYAVIQPPDFRWHVPSIRYDPRRSPAMTRFFGRIRVALSIHGFGRNGLDRTVLLGGRNRPLARRFGAALRAATDLHIIDDIDAIPEGLRGLHPGNPVNLPEHDGVQVELSPGARTPEHLPVLIGVMGRVLAAEQRSLCAAETC